MIPNKISDIKYNIAMNEKINYLQDPDEFRPGENIVSNTITPGYTIQLGPTYTNTNDSLICSGWSYPNENPKLKWKMDIKLSEPVLKFPEIKRVIFNNKATIVFFDDDTKVIVKKSDNDEYDKEHAVVYAILKRLWGTVESDKTVSSNGFMQKLKKIVKAGDEVSAFKKDKKAGKSKGKCKK